MGLLIIICFGMCIFYLDKIYEALQKIERKHNKHPKNHKELDEV